ncbi:MAG: class I SAM-dependent methyltransferase [Deltaproteobacteria bacterium]|nr:class I SAM-dependent methyltransferase [Deltaproteobacteria bacterium]
MERESLYTHRAELYDAIYDFKPYPAEAERLRELLSQRGVEEGSRVLDAACGTGSHLLQLRRWYRVAGFDLHAGMLEIARRKLPGVELFSADMADFRVEEPFDALLCLFSSIGYLLSEERLEAAAGCFARALRPGGVLVVEPFLSRQEYKPGRLVLQSADGEKLKCARACIPGLDGDRAVIDYHWLVLRSGQAAVEHFTERHELRLCSRETMTEIFDRAGFAVSHEPRGLVPGRGLLVARRREAG